MLFLYSEALVRKLGVNVPFYPGNDYRLCWAFIDGLKRGPFLRVRCPLQGLGRSMGEQFSERRKAKRVFESEVQPTLRSRSALC